MAEGKSSKGWIAAIVAVALVIIAGAAFLLRGGEDGDVLRVANQRGSTKSMMIASGALEGAPYRVEWSEFPAAQHLLEALGSGSVDLGLAGDAPFIFAYQSGSPIKAVGAHAQEARQPGALAILVPKDSPIRSVRDLIGKRISTTRGSVGHHLILEALEREKLAADDVVIVFLPPGDAKAAFDRGSIDAWAMWSPYTIVALKEGARIIADGSAFGPSAGFEIAHIDSIEPKRALIEDFLKREAKALQWAQANPDAYAKVLSEETGLPIDIAKEVVVRNRRVAVPIDETIIRHEQEIADRFQRAGILQIKRPLSEAFDPGLTAALFSGTETNAEVEAPAAAGE